MADDSPRSNARLVRDTLLRNHAEAASFSPLADVRLPEDQELAAASARVANLPLPADVVVLGMGEDGHTASWFPGADGLAEAMEAHLEAATHLFRSEGLSSAPLEKAWREQRQLAARGTRPSPPLSALHRRWRKPKSGHPKEEAFHAEPEKAAPYPHRARHGLRARAIASRSREKPSGGGLRGLFALTADEESTVTRLKAHARLHLLSRSYRPDFASRARTLPGSGRRACC